jgi:hypothetical protein
MRAFVSQAQAVVSVSAQQRKHTHRALSGSTVIVVQASITLPINDPTLC